MSARTPGSAGSPTGRLVGTAARHPGRVLLVTLVLVAAAGWVTGARLGVDPSTSGMFPEELSWRRDIEAFRRAFPQLSDNLVLVVDAATGPLAEDAAGRLAGRLEERPDLFGEVYRAGGGAYLRRSRLLFRDREELESLRDRLEALAPELRRFEAAPSLASFAAALDSVLAEEAGDRSPGVLGSGGALRLVARSFQMAAARAHFRVPWSRLLGGEGGGRAGGRRVVVASLAEDPGRAGARGEAVTAARAAAGGFDRSPRGPRIRLTGPVAMEHEGLAAAGRSARYASVLAFVLVGLLLYLGIGSSWLIGAVLATLAAGLALTFGFAALAVGELNLISIAFVVLFIGLGVDYGLHVTLRYQELRLQGRPSIEVLRITGREVGAAIALSAVTTALCFFAFVPTDFSGVSQLGLIGGAGMIIGCVTTLTVLPALLSWRDRPLRRGPVAGRRALTRLASGLERHRRAVLLGGVCLALLGAALLPAVRFDHDPLHLRDPDAESVRAYLDLLRDPDFDPLTVSAMRPDGEAAADLAGRLDALPVVKRTVTLSSFVPSNQAEKLPVIGEIRALLGPSPSRPRGDRSARPADAGEIRGRSAGEMGTGWEAAEASLEALRFRLSIYGETAEPDAASAARFLAFATRSWEATARLWPLEERSALVAELERDLLADLVALVRDLRAAAAVREPIGESDLPSSLRRRWISPSGLHRVEVRPAVDAARTEELRAFVDGVRRIAPHATGAPVTQLEAGRAAVGAFSEALLLAAAALFLVLLVALRSPSLALRVLVPLALAAVLTAGSTVLMELPFNFANLITVPLLLGVGVDAGVHLVHRSRWLPGDGGVRVVATSTGRALVLAFLTTIVSFGNLGFSTHRGMASMGRVLTVGMVLTLLCVLTVLPLLLPQDGESGRSAVGRGLEGDRAE